MEPTNNNPPQPTTFSDGAGREWTIVLDFAKLRAIKRRLSIDLGNIERFAQAWSEILYDDDKALAVVWITLADQAAAASTSEEEWLAAMDGDRLEEAIAALRAAVENFTRPWKRATLSESATAVETVYRKALEQSHEQITKAVNQATDRAIRQAFGTKRQKSPASSAGSTKAGRSGKRSRR